MNPNLHITDRGSQTRPPDEVLVPDFLQYHSLSTVRLPNWTLDYLGCNTNLSHSSQLTPKEQSLPSRSQKRRRRLLLCLRNLFLGPGCYPSAAPLPPTAILDLEFCLVLITSLPQALLILVAAMKPD